MSKNQNKLVANSPAAWPLLLREFNICNIWRDYRLSQPQATHVFPLFSLHSPSITVPLACCSLQQGISAVSHELPSHPLGLNRLCSCESTGRSVAAVSFRSWLSCVRNLEKGGKNEGFELQKGEFERSKKSSSLDSGMGWKKQVTTWCDACIWGYSMTWHTSLRKIGQRAVREAWSTGGKSAV